MNESALERLTQVHPDMEIWWDSSPLVFRSWVKETIDAASPARRAILEEQLNRIYVVDDPAKSLIRGCTTNPPLSLTAVKSDPQFWQGWIDDMIASAPSLTLQGCSWLTYKEVIRRGAEMMLPIWQASNGRYGYISGQLDPRLFTETERMIRDAQELRTIAPNVMVKVPASTQGVEVVKVLTSLAIPTNVTTCFTLPQIWAVAKAAAEGVKIAETNKVDMSKWRAVITMMIGRLTENPVLDEQAARRGITLSWADKHWFGIYTFRKAFQLLKATAMPSKMLACSMREGPLVSGTYHFWDVEKIAGDIVYTMPPYVIGPLLSRCENLSFKEEILFEDIPDDVLFKINKIPYCLQASDPNGMEIDQFNSHPATLATVDTFAKASAGLEEYVGGRMVVVRGKSIPFASGR
jgi:transaldolase